MVVCCLEPSKITFWASRWWPSSQARVTSAKSESLSSIKFPNALLMLSWKSFHWRLVKEEQTISLFSFYSRNFRNVTSTVCICFGRRSVAVQRRWSNGNLKAIPGRYNLPGDGLPSDMDSHLWTPGTFQVGRYYTPKNSKRTGKIEETNIGSQTLLIYSQMLQLNHVCSENYQCVGKQIPSGQSLWLSIPSMFFRDPLR